MTDQQTDPQPLSFAEFLADRREHDRAVAAYVEGDLGHEPPLGNSAAKLVADKLAGEDEVQRIEPADAEEAGINKDVGAVLLALPRDPADEHWRPVQRRLLSRVPSGVSIVVLVDTNAVPWFCKDLADVRVVADGIDDEIEVYRVQLDHMSGEVYYRRFTEVELTK